MKKQAVLLLVTVLLLIINLNYISAESNNSTDNSIPDISLNYPSSVNFGNEFNIGVALNNFPNDSYDVRIGILDNGTRIARIWNGSYWQSTYYYINDIINTNEKNSESFRMNVTSCRNGNYNLEIKIRDSKNHIYNFNNYSINVIGNCNIVNPPVDNTDPTDDEDTTDSTDSQISLNLDWNDNNIENGKEFEVKLTANNLEDKDYDVKVYIYDEDSNKPISQTYSDNKWQSSNNYINEFFSGPGSESKKVKLRIKDSSRDFDGTATIGVRIREHGSSTYKKEIEVSIDILEGDDASSTSTSEDSTLVDNEDTNSLINQNEESVDEAPLTGNVIHLGTSKIKSESIKSKKNMVYQSNNELIKKYSVYSFTGLLVIFWVALVFLGIKQNLFFKSR